MSGGNLSLDSGIVITLHHNNAENISEEVYFSYYTDDMEMLAGMAAVLLPLLADLNDISYQVSPGAFQPYNNTIGDGTYYQLHSAANLQEYRLKRHLREEDIKSTVLQLLPTNIVQWIRNQNEFFYDAYTFTTLSFMQGVFTILNYFNADYRNYLYGMPYDGSLRILEIPEYGLVAPNITISDVPNIDDIEEEEVDDENIISGFERTDDIITITSTSNYFNISSPDEVNQEVYVV